VPVPTLLIPFRKGQDHVISRFCDPFNYYGETTFPGFLVRPVSYEVARCAAACEGRVAEANGCLHGDRRPAPACQVDHQLSIDAPRDPQARTAGREKDANRTRVLHADRRLRKVPPHFTAAEIDEAKAEAISRRRAHLRLPKKAAAARKQVTIPVIFFCSIGQ